MFKVLEIKNYNTNHSYGTDWHTDYICETDEEINSETELIEKVKETGHEPCGEISMDKKDGKIILKTKMY